MNLRFKHVTDCAIFNRPRYDGECDCWGKTCMEIPDMENRMGRVDLEKWLLLGLTVWSVVVIIAAALFAFGRY